MADVTSGARRPTAREARRSPLSHLNHQGPTRAKPIQSEHLNRPVPCKHKGTADTRFSRHPVEFGHRPNAPSGRRFKSCHPDWKVPGTLRGLRGFRLARNGWGSERAPLIHSLRLRLVARDVSQVASSIAGWIVRSGSCLQKAWNDPQPTHNAEYCERNREDIRPRGQLSVSGWGVLNRTLLVIREAQ